MLITDTVAQEVIAEARRLPVHPSSSDALADRIADLCGLGQATSPSGTWIMFDGPSGAGKDTQIRLLAHALDHQVQAATIDCRGVGTLLGDPIRRISQRNLQQPDPPAWRADLLLKVAAWKLLRSRTAALGLDEHIVVISNRSLLSQLAYSAATLADPKIINDFGPHEWRPGSDAVIVLLPPPDELSRRIAARSRTGAEPARHVDHPDFISQAIDGFHALAGRVPVATVISTTGPPQEVFGAVTAALASVGLGRTAN